MNRRMVLSLITLSALALLLVAVAVIFLNALRHQPVSWRAVATVSELETGHPRNFVVEGKRLYLTLIDATPVAVSVRDPHPRGCEIEWNGERRLFVESCLGSQYARDGKWLAGPSPRHMDRFAVRLVNGEIEVNVAEVIKSAHRP